MVRLVDDHGVSTRQEITEALFLHCQVGHEQVMVDDDQIGLARGLARRYDMAVLEPCAA